MKLRDRFARFMYGRYGADIFSKFIMWTALILMIIAMLSRIYLIYIIALILVVYMYFRMFSKNITKRSAENRAFLQITGKVTGKFKGMASRNKMRKDFRIFKCPACKTMVKIPKGRGKVEITCPKCRHSFIRKA